MSESQRQYLERRLAEGKQRLQDKKDDKEAFDCSLEMVAWLLDDLEDSLAPNECEESYKESGRVLEWLHSYIKDALDLAPAFTTPESEAALRQALDKVDNLRILVWNWQKKVEREREPTDKSSGKWVCPAMLYYRGVTDLLEATPDDLKWCELECPYISRCDPSPTQRLSPVTP